MAPTADPQPTTVSAAVVFGEEKARQALLKRPLDTEDQAVLDRLGACPPASQAGDRLAVPHGVILPPGAILTKQTEQGAKVQLDGWVGLDPVRIRRFYQVGVLGRAKPLQIEDEVIEAEVLLEFPGGRFFVKAVAACATMSWLTIVASSTDGANLEPSAEK